MQLRGCPPRGLGRPHRLGPPPPPAWGPGGEEKMLSKYIGPYASNIACLRLEYRISMPRISDLHASNIGSVCLEYRISASNIGPLCLGYRISMARISNFYALNIGYLPRISDLYASNIGFPCLEYTYINASSKKK